MGVTGSNIGRYGRRGTHEKTILHVCVHFATLMLNSRISIGDGKLYPGTSSVTFRASVMNSYVLRQYACDCCGVGFSSIILMWLDEKGLSARDLVAVVVSAWHQRGSRYTIAQGSSRNTPGSGASCTVQRYLLPRSA